MSSPTDALAIQLSAAVFSIYPRSGCCSSMSRRCWSSGKSWNLRRPSHSHESSSGFPSTNVSKCTLYTESMLTWPLVPELVVVYPPELPEPAEAEADEEDEPLVMMSDTKSVVRELCELERWLLEDGAEKRSGGEDARTSVLIGGKSCLGCHYPGRAGPPGNCVAMLATYWKYGCSPKQQSSLLYHPSTTRKWITRIREGERKMVTELLLCTACSTVRLYVLSRNNTSLKPCIIHVNLCVYIVTRHSYHFIQLTKQPPLTLFVCPHNVKEARVSSSSGASKDPVSCTLGSYRYNPPSPSRTIGLVDTFWSLHMACTGKCIVCLRGRQYMAHTPISRQLEDLV